MGFICAERYYLGSIIKITTDNLSSPDHRSDSVENGVTQARVK